MTALLVVIFVALLGGVAVGLQGPLSSLMSQRLGVLESIFIVHIGGALLTLVPLLIKGGGNLLNWKSVPWYALGAGAFGLVVISSMSYAIPRLGVTAAIMVLVAAQLTVSVVLDHFGLLGAEVRRIDLSRLLGIAVLFAGVWLVVKK
jgi:transporter family-2 protein